MHLSGFHVFELPPWTFRETANLGLAAVFTALVWVVAHYRPALVSRAAQAYRISTSHRRRYILAAALLPVVIRVSILPWIPPPLPRVHDEAGHLLIADTLLAGRLANPPHPLWRSLETIYILQHPAYASKYPIGQGIMLAAGKALTGHPWAGVLLAVALMCGAISWMLFGCLPPAWAAAGGLLASFSYGLNPDWIDSYWGGAFCAFGGALVFGALCRLRYRLSLPLALSVGAGWSIVWLTRPFESLSLLLLIWALIGVFIVRDPKRWKAWVPFLALLLSLHAVTLGLTLLHNRAVTGSFTKLPYQLAQEQYGVPQGLFWQPPVNVPPLRFKEQQEVYQWQLDAKARQTTYPISLLEEILLNTWNFYISPWFSLPLLALVFLRQDRMVILGAAIVLCVLLVAVVYPFFNPHYIAAYACVFLYLITRGFGALSRWSPGGKPAGMLLVQFLMFWTLVIGFRVFTMSRATGIKKPTLADIRQQLSRRLLKMGGRHVVFVRYGPRHQFHYEWVYNTADIDTSPIVWCRAGDAQDEEAVRRYYPDRQFWMADVDLFTAHVFAYAGPQPGGLPASLGVELPIQGK